LTLLQLTAIGVAFVAVIWCALVGAFLLAGRRNDAAALARFIPDSLVLVKRLLADRRVSRRRKLILIPLIAYLASPIDVVPDFIPVVGQLDDAIVIGFALRVILRAGDRRLLEELWPGPRESLSVVEGFAFGRSQA
jgi:uncharacterized membrane protein YkvA (DUF1232 family)